MAGVLPSYMDILKLGKPKKDNLNAPASDMMAQTSEDIWNNRNQVPGAEMINQAPSIQTPVQQSAGTPIETKPSTVDTQKQAVTDQPEKATPYGSYADMFVALNPYKPMTAEERAAEEKRNRRNAMFAAISDGISALSNLYFTTKGAPNSFNGGSTLSGKMYERQRQLMKDREAREKDYLNGYLKALEMDRSRAAQERTIANQERNWRLKLDELAYKRKRDAADDALKAAKEERDKELHDLNLKYKQGQLNKQEFDTKASEAKAKYAEAYERARIASLNRRNTGGSGRGSSSDSLWPYPVNGEDIELPKTFWSNAGEVNGLYSMLPQDVRDNIEHEYTSTGRVKKVIKPSLEQKRQAIMDNATPEIMNRLRSKSKDFGGTVTQKPSSSSAPWLNNGSSTFSNNNAPWLQ